jgi:signal transduction histidine kinase/ActR/RegA family two-component response regulator
MTAPSLEQLRLRLDALEKENRVLREALEAAACVHLIDANALAYIRASAVEDDLEINSGWAALASSQAEAQVGRADLLASKAALASSQAETKVGRADLLASEAALAWSQAETKVGRADLLASETANSGLEVLAHELRQARDAAERANHAKSRFLAAMSHELRTPLNGMLGYTQLLRLDGGLNEVQSARVKAMLDAGMHLLEMVEGVLDLSEIEAERVELHLSEVNLRRVADACLDLVRPMAEAKKVALGLSIALDVPAAVMTDPKRLRQVLLNLLGNAVKFTAKGAIDLRLRTSAEGANLRLEVADTGPGIPSEFRPRMFEEFAQLGASASTASSSNTVEGAGLGLSLSRQLAVLMGGQVGYDDNPGGGSVFWLELPLVQTNAALRSPAAAMAPSTLRVAPTPARRLRVLVVDDVAMNRDIAGAFIRSAGHVVVCAEGGAEAIAAVASTDFDVVMMDVRMPGMDGLEATRRIRALGGPRGQVPIVAMTAQAFADQMAECREAGMDSHVAKPFTLDSLLKALASSQRDTACRLAASTARGPGKA